MQLLALSLHRMSQLYIATFCIVLSLSVKGSLAAIDRHFTLMCLLRHWLAELGSGGATRWAGALDADRQERQAGFGGDLAGGFYAIWSGCYSCASKEAL